MLNIEILYLERLTYNLSYLFLLHSSVENVMLL